MVVNYTSDREQKLLKLLINRYIQSGQPVGSKALAEEIGQALSSATIRNVLADLEEKGYLVSRHTSAGRIPTAKGYRLFIDSLLTFHQPDAAELTEFKMQLNPDLNTPQLVETASGLLSQITQLTGLVTIPKREKVILRHVEFLPLSENRILVILVINRHEVQNRIIYTNRIYSASELEQTANFLSNTFGGKDLLTIRHELVKAIKNAKSEIDQVMSTAIEVAEKAFISPPSSDDYVLAGQKHLFNLAEQTSIDHLRELFDTFNQKRDILYLLDQCLSAEGVQIFIGEESKHNVLRECSLITSSYSVHGEVVGALGVIGPTRIRYDKVIPLVDITAKLLSAALSEGEKS